MEGREEVTEGVVQPVEETMWGLPPVLCAVMSIPVVSATFNVVQETSQHL